MELVEKFETKSGIFKAIFPKEALQPIGNPLHIFKFTSQPVKPPRLYHQFFDGAYLLTNVPYRKKAVDTPAVVET